MHVYALFDNESAEPVNIRFLNVAAEKNQLNIHPQSFNSPKVKASAYNGIECAYEIIFSGDIKRYIQESPISVTPKDFKEQVDGASAGLAYALAFVALLEDKDIISSSFPKIGIAATGELDNQGNVKKIKHLKQKILAAIKENIGLVFYPSENYEDLKNFLEEDNEFKTAVENSGILLKHVFHLKQAFCELMILPCPKLTISPCRREQKNVYYNLKLTNEVQLEFDKLNLAIEYDYTRLKFSNIKSEGLINDIECIEHESDDKNKRKLALSIKSRKEMAIAAIGNNVLLEICFSDIGDSVKQDSDMSLVEFYKEECSISNFPYNGISGIIFESIRMPLPVDDTKASGPKTSDNDKKKDKRPVKEFALISTVIVLIFLFTYTFFSNKIMSKNDDPVPSNTDAPVFTETPKPIYTSTPTPTLHSPTNSPSPTPEPTITPVEKANETATSTPTVLKTSTPLPTKQELPTLTPKTVLATKEIVGAEKNSNWESKSKSAEVKLEKDKDGNSVRIDYNIKGNGYVTIKTVQGLFDNIDVGYRELGFYYRCFSEINTNDTVVVKIYFDNSVKSYSIGSTEGISKKNKWEKKSLGNIDVSKINAIEFFIGTIGAGNDSVNKGSFLVRDFYISP